jgi:peptide/nickel transport system permease protein
MTGTGAPTDGIVAENPPAAVRATPPAPRATSSARMAWRTFAANRLALVGLAILVLFVLFCYVGPHLYHTEQIQSDLIDSNLPPGGGHPLGTDSNGFDELGRLMRGGQAALEIGFLSALITTVIGTLYGALSGLAGGIVDAVLMRIVDVLLSIPFLFIVLIVATRYSASVLSLSLILGLFSWLISARLVRAEVLSLRERDFVAAGRVMGATKSRLVFRHLIPNALSVVVVNVTFQVAEAVVAVALLGFLGFGLAFPQVSWGDMLANANVALADNYWWLVYPVGVALILVVMSCNLVGDGLRDAIDVRLRKR